MNKKLVSVVVPTYNRSRLVTRAIHSVLSQTYSYLECIVVDDASNDDTDRVVQSIQDDRLVYLRHETRRHASAARNTGIAHAKGDLIAFLDDDDEWLPTKVEKQVALLLSFSDNVGMVYCWMDYFDEQGSLIKKHHPELKGYIFPHVIDAQRLGGCPTLLVRREVVGKVGGFDESLLRGNDGDFIRRVCREYEVDYVPEVMVKVHVGHGLGQITSYDEKGIRNHINAQLTKLKKFETDFCSYPRQAANIYADIAYHYGWLNDWRLSTSFYWKAIVAFPYSIKVFTSLICSLKQALRSTVLRP